MTCVRPLEYRPVITPLPSMAKDSRLPVVVLQVDEKESRALVGALAPLLKELGVEVVVSDDLGSYRLLAWELGVGH